MLLSSPSAAFGSGSNTNAAKRRRRHGHAVALFPVARSSGDAVLDVSARSSSDVVIVLDSGASWANRGDYQDSSRCSRRKDVVITINFGDASLDHFDPSPFFFFFFFLLGKQN